MHSFVHVRLGWWDSGTHTARAVVINFPKRRALSVPTQFAASTTTSTTTSTAAPTLHTRLPSALVSIEGPGPPAISSNPTLIEGGEE